jgi:hypothetical protein
MNLNFGGSFTENTTIAGNGTNPVEVAIGGTTTPLDVNIGGGTAALTTDVNIGGTTPLVTDMNIGGTATPLATDITLHTPDVLRTRSEITSDSRMFVDLRPVVMDMCATLNFGRVPEVCVRQPYEHRFRMTLFGTEIMAFEFRGENRSYIENMPGRPAVVGAGRGGDPPAGKPDGEHPRPFDYPPADGGAGLVIPV